MALGCQVDDAVHMFLLHQFVYSLKVADVHLHKLVVGPILYILQIGKVASVGQFVEIDDFIVWIFVHK